MMELFIFVIFVHFLIVFFKGIITFINWEKVIKVLYWELGMRLIIPKYLHINNFVKYYSIFISVFF